MPQPIPPSSIQDAIPAPSGNFCEKFIKVLNIPKLFYQWFAYTFLESGEFTPEFIADLCAVKCNCSGAVVSGCTGDSTVTTPENVQATDGQYTDKVRVTWNAAAGSTGYEVWRSIDSPNYANAIRITTTTATDYEDATPMAGHLYWYWIKSTVSGRVSSCSSPDSGYVLGSNTGQQEYGTPGEFTFVVPASVSSLTVTIVGGGAGGGGGAASGDLRTAGGGGGAGEIASNQAVVVTPGETLTVVVANVAVPGHGRATSASLLATAGTGQNGFASALKRGATVLVSANGGTGGGPGTAKGDDITACVCGTGGAGGTGTAATDGGAGANAVCEANFNSSVGGAGGILGAAGTPSPYGAGGVGGDSTPSQIARPGGLGYPGYVKITW